MSNQADLVSAGRVRCRDTVKAGIFFLSKIHVVVEFLHGGIGLQHKALQHVGTPHELPYRERDRDNPPNERKNTLPSDLLLDISLARLLLLFLLPLFKERFLYVLRNGTR